MLALRLSRGTKGMVASITSVKGELWGQVGRLTGTWQTVFGSRALRGMKNLNNRFVFGSAMFASRSGLELCVPAPILETDHQGCTKLCTLVVDSFALLMTERLQPGRGTWYVTR